jgi:hypothetical protein
MKAKTLLIAVAALAAGVISSQAQVYSQNIVGYANVNTPNGGTYLISVPFKIGVSNGANEVWPLVGGNPSLPDYSSILVWDGASYTTYVSDSTSPTLWDDAGFAPLTAAPVLPVGKGFFLVPSASVTNTFAGVISVSVNSSNLMSLPNGGTYLIASPVPYAGSITNGDSTTGVGGVGLSSLNGLPDYSSILVWNGASYDTYVSDSTSPSLWDDAGFAPLAAPPTIAVGQSIFIVPSADFTWKVGL